MSVNNKNFKMIELNKINTIDNYCKCKCHKEGQLHLHVYPCCNLIGKEYLDSNGNLIKEKLENLILEYTNI
jgi:hypothetical protein